MTTFSFDRKVFEVQEYSPVDQPGFHYECWDLTPDSGGQLGTIVVPEGASGPEGVVFELAATVPAGVLLRWMSFVPELRAFSIEPNSS